MRISRINGRKTGKAIFPFIAALAASVMALALFGGCSVTPIFATIETEIPLATPTIRNITSELFSANPSGTAKELYLSNGKLKRKTVTSNTWTEVPLPASGIRVMNIATDTLDGNGSLYALFVNESDWVVFNSIQRYDGSTWTVVDTNGASIDKIGSGNGRIYAFVKTGQSGTGFTYSINAITGTAFNATALQAGITKPLATSGDYVATSDTVYHWNGSALETATVTGKVGTNISVATDVAGNGYVLTSGGVYVSNGATWTSHAYSITSPAQSIAVLEAGTTDFILVSGMNGYCEITGDAGTSWSTTSQSPGISATSSISTTAKGQYTSSLALYCVSSVFAIAGPTPSGDPYVIYASVLNDTFDGLWGYYPTSRPNWNRES